jgi:hypothetical protein
MEKSSLLRLPIELLDEVIGGLESSHLASLCLVSKTLNSACGRFLYRMIQLSTPRQAVLCCKALARNSHLAQAVRAFGIISDR